MNIFNIVSILCLTLCVVMFLYFKWYINKRTASSSSDERQTEMYKLMAEIDRITDRDSQLVEDRVNRLKTLLHEVDERIALYEKELEEQAELPVKKSTETLYTSLGRGIRSAFDTPETEPPKAVLSEPPQVIPPAPQTLPPELVQALPVQAELIPPEPTPSKPASKKQIRTHIDILVNEGLSPEEIASRLEISVAEVNLAMNLRRKKN